MDKYFSSLKETKVRSLQELVDWNNAHSQEALTEGMSPLDILQSILLIDLRISFPRSP